MDTLNRIALDTDKSEKLATQLNDLLANYSVLYQNTRGFHWNIKGHKFFELHVKFEELYTDLATKIDEIAERILTLGEIPAHKYSDYLDNSAIKESQEVFDGFKAVEQILLSFKILLAKQRVILSLSGESNDEGTNALMSDYIREQEKLVWMYASYLQK
jgi:starvation-inducible DNA-binding protein